MLENIINAITSGLSSLFDTVSNLSSSLGNWFVDLFNNLSSLFSELGGSLGTWFSDLFSNLSDNFTDLFSNITSNFSNLGTNLSNWLSYINPGSENFLGNKLIELLGNLFNYLFIPTEDNVTELQETVNSKFKFISSIELAVNDIKDMLNNIENGTSEFTIDIDSEYYEGEVIVFDLSWYVPFKAYGDLVFTGFAYVFFIIRLWKAIPGIINGSSAITDTIVGGVKHDN